MRRGGRQRTTRACRVGSGGGGSDRSPSKGELGKGSQRARGQCPLRGGAAVEKKGPAGRSGFEHPRLESQSRRVTAPALLRSLCLRPRPRQAGDRRTQMSGAQEPSSALRQLYTTFRDLCCRYTCVCTSVHTQAGASQLEPPNITCTTKGKCSHLFTDIARKRARTMLRAHRLFVPSARGVKSAPGPLRAASRGMADDSDQAMMRPEDIDTRKLYRDCLRLSYHIAAQVRCWCCSCEARAAGMRSCANGCARRVQWPLSPKRQSAEPQERSLPPMRGTRTGVPAPCRHRAPKATPCVR